jgi:hypothetical protein
MNGPVDPIRRSSPSRRALVVQRDPGDDSARDAEFEDVVYVRDDKPALTPRKGGFATFAAHLMGQSGQKRGLRGGQEVLDSARSTYLGTEFSGGSDRRPQTGLLKKTQI